MLENYFPYTFVRIIVGQIYFDQNCKDLAFASFRNAYDGKLNFENPWDEFAMPSYIDLLLERDVQEAIRILKCTLSGRTIFSFFARKLIKQISEKSPELLVEHLNYLERAVAPKFMMSQVVPVKQIADEYIELSAPQKFVFTDPLVYNAEIPPAEHEIEVPVQFVARVCNAEIVGAFQVLKDSKFVLCEPASHPKFGIVAGVWRNFCAVGPKGDQTLVFSEALPQIEIEDGILLSGRATENYFHWLIEYLPKILNVNDAKIPNNVPLIVKPNLPKQFYEALELLCPERKLFKLDPTNVSLVVKNLWVSSIHTFHPDDFKLPYWQGGAVSYRHLSFLKNTILKGMPNLKANIADGKKVKIYLARKSGRAVENDYEVISTLEQKGFRIIYPEKLSFLEQVELFNSADLIVGATGAAFSNLIFVRPQARVVVLVSERNATYCMKSNLAQFAGARFIHLVGKHVHQRSKYATEDEFVHSNFYVDIAALSSTIGEIEKEWSQLR